MCLCLHLQTWVHAGVHHVKLLESNGHSFGGGGGQKSVPWHAAWCTQLCFDSHCDLPVLSLLAQELLLWDYSKPPSLFLLKKTAKYLAPAFLSGKTDLSAGLGKITFADG